MYSDSILKITNVYPIKKMLELPEMQFKIFFLEILKSEVPEITHTVGHTEGVWVCGPW
jgi:hypothetical protein